MSEHTKIVEKEGTMVLQIERVVKDLDGDLYIGTKYSWDLSGKQSKMERVKEAPVEKKGKGAKHKMPQKVLDMLKTNKNHLGFKISQAMAIPEDKVEKAAKHNPPRFFLQYNDETALLVRPVAGMQVEPSWPADQSELHIDFSSKHRSRSSKKSKEATQKGKGQEEGKDAIEMQKTQMGGQTAGAAALQPLSDWFRGQGHIPTAVFGRQPAVYFGYISIMITITVPESSKNRKKWTAVEDREFEEFMKHTMMCPHTETTTEEGSLQYTGYHFLPYNSAAKMPDKGGRYFSCDFLLLDDSTPKGKIPVHGFRIIHCLGNMEKTFEGQLPIPKFPFHSGGISYECLGRSLNFSGFMLTTFFVPPKGTIRAPAEHKEKEGEKK